MSKKHDFSTFWGNVFIFIKITWTAFVCITLYLLCQFKIHSSKVMETYLTNLCTDGDFGSPNSRGGSSSTAAITPLFSSSLRWVLPTRWAWWQPVAQGPSIEKKCQQRVLPQYLLQTSCRRVLRKLVSCANERITVVMGIGHWLTEHNWPQATMEK